MLSQALRGGLADQETEQPNARSGLYVSYVMPSVARLTAEARLLNILIQARRHGNLEQGDTKFVRFALTDPKVAPQAISVIYAVIKKRDIENETKELLNYLLSELSSRSSAKCYIASQALTCIREDLSEAQRLQCMEELFENIIFDSQDSRNATLNAIKSLAKNSETLLSNVHDTIGDWLIDYDPLKRETACDLIISFASSFSKGQLTTLIDALSNKLFDLNDDVQSVAVDAFVAIAPKLDQGMISRLIIPLLNQLRDEHVSPMIRQRAANVFACIAPLLDEAQTQWLFDYINAIINHRDLIARECACLLISAIGPKLIFEQVIFLEHSVHKCLQDKCPNVRQAACYAAGAMRSKSSPMVEAVLNCLTASEISVREAAEKAITKAISESSLYSEADAILDMMINKVKKSQPVLCYAILKVITNVLPSLHTSQPDRLITPLAEQLTVDDWTMRQHATEALKIISKQGSTIPIEVTLQLLVNLNHSEWILRNTSLDALKSIVPKLDPETMKLILSPILILLDDSNAFVQNSAFYCLISMVISRKLEQECLIKIADHIHPYFTSKMSWVRKSSCHLVKEIILALEDQNAIPPLLSLLHHRIGDEEPDVRIAACRAVGEIGQKLGPEEISPLKDDVIHCLKDTSINVRHAARNTISVFWHEFHRDTAFDEKPVMQIPLSVIQSFSSSTNQSVQKSATQKVSQAKMGMN